MTRPTAAVTIGNTSIDVEHDEKLIKALLAEGNNQVQIDLEDVSDEHIDTLFGSLMQSAMASGGRRLAIEWMKRLDVPGNAGERARHAMAQTINLQGLTRPPVPRCWLGVCRGSAGWNGVQNRSRAPSQGARLAEQPAPGRAL